MTPHIIYAKKMRLPSTSANILQSLNMILAFATTGARVDCFPGHASRSFSTGKTPEAIPDAIARRMGCEGASPVWFPLSGEHKGWYGLQFRCALLKSALAAPEAIFYGRDTAELLFLAGLRRFFPRALFFEAHEVLHLMHKNDGRTDWEKTRRQEKRILASLDGLVATTQVVAEEMREHLDYGGPLLVAPNGFNPRFFHPVPLFTPERNWPGENETLSLVYVGTFHPGKGIRELLESLTLLPERFCLRIIGGAPEHAYAELQKNVREKKLCHRVVLHGQVDQSEIHTLCKDAHIFVIPQQSSFYFSPLKLQEALALGLPVIVTPLPLFSDQLARGLVSGAPDSSPQGIARGILDLAGRPSLAEALRRRGLRESSEYSWEKRAEKVLGFMNETLERTSAARV